MKGGFSQAPPTTLPTLPRLPKPNGEDRQTGLTGVYVTYLAYVVKLPVYLNLPIRRRAVIRNQMTANRADLDILDLRVHCFHWIATEPLIRKPTMALFSSSLTIDLRLTNLSYESVNCVGLFWEGSHAIAPMTSILRGLACLVLRCTSLDLCRLICAVIALVVLRLLLVSLDCQRGMMERKYDGRQVAVHLLLD